MLKRTLSLFFALLLLLHPSFSMADCLHHDENGVPYGMVP